MATRSLMQRRLSRARRTCQHAGNASGRLVRAIDRSSTTIRYYRGEFSHLRHDLAPQSRSRQKLYDGCYASSFGCCGRCYEVIRFVLAYALKNVEQNRHVGEHWDRAAEHVLNEPHRRATIRRETPRKCSFPVASSSTRYFPIEFIPRRNKTRLDAQPLPTSFPTILSFHSNTISLSVPNFGADIWNTWNRLESAQVELQASSSVGNDTNSSPYIVQAAIPRDSKCFGSRSYRSSVQNIGRSQFRLCRLRFLDFTKSYQNFRHEMFDGYILVRAIIS